MRRQPRNPTLRRRHHRHPRLSTLALHIANGAPRTGSLRVFEWIFHYRRKSLPTITHTIATHAKHVHVHTLHNPNEVRRFLGSVSN